MSQNLFRSKKQTNSQGNCFGTPGTRRPSRSNHAITSIPLEFRIITAWQEAGRVSQMKMFALQALTLNPSNILSAWQLIPSFSSELIHTSQFCTFFTPLISSLLVPSSLERMMTFELAKTSGISDGISW